ncbi:MAG: formylglycine-generating enzyme family protein [Methylococcaceae bacterium]|nr:formylglycine-generating enzyme family protein [Methylococcaceae bacterium]
MKNLFGHFLVFCILIFLPVSAFAKGDESHKSSVKSKHYPKSRLELEIEQIKKEMQEMKNQIRIIAQKTDAESSEQPSARIDMVQLPSGLKMGKYEVTQGQWQAVMGSNPSQFNSCGNACPVEQVSWDDIQNFIGKLNKLSGHIYRLPTEEEWYNACQASSPIEYCGSKDIDAVAWFSGNSGNSTHAVGGKQANAYGLYDMSGNVWEWVDTCYEGDCAKRVFRGGSWYYSPEYLHADYRGWNSSDFRSFLIGFRLVQDR